MEIVLKIQINQLKDEYYKKKVNMSVICNYKHYQVFIGMKLRLVKQF